MTVLLVALHAVKSWPACLPFLLVGSRLLQSRRDWIGQTLNSASAIIK